MTLLKKGDKVRCTNPIDGLVKGAIYTLYNDQYSDDPGNCIDVQGPGLASYAGYFNSRFVPLIKHSEAVQSLTFGKTTIETKTVIESVTLKMTEVEARTLVEFVEAMELSQHVPSDVQRLIDSLKGAGIHLLSAK